MSTPEEQREQLFEFARAKRKRFAEFVLESPDAVIADLYNRCKSAYIEDRGVTEAGQLIQMHEAIFSPFLVYLDGKGITRQELKEEFVDIYIEPTEPI